MKSSNLKWFSAGILTFTLAAATTLAAPSFAQAPMTLAQTAIENDELVEDDDSDWGWLGLLGLIGLAGLAGRSRKERPTTYQDPNAPGSSYR